MKAIWKLAVAAFLSMMASFAGAAVEQADKMAPEPTVSAVWIVVFLVVFVLFCVGLVIGIRRADKQNESEGRGK